VPPPTRKPLYSVGLSYQLLSWARPFVDASTSFQPGPQPFNPYGVPRLSPTGKGLIPDVGVKFNNPDRSLVGTITYAPKNIIKNEDIAIDASYVTAINPAGINGQYAPQGAPNSQINADKESSSLGLRLTYQPKNARHFRSTFSFDTTDGKILTSSNFAQLYNDQFYTKGGAVTYADGTPLLVDPKGGSATPTVPLTLAMINDPTNVFYANPDPDSGSIGTSNSAAGGGALRSVLTKQDPVHGTAATGVTGLPLSAIQYTFTDPNGHKGVLNPVSAGDKTTGYYHYNFSTVNVYQFSEGRLKGASIGSAVSAGYQFRSHYYPTYPAGETTSTKALDQTKALYIRPTIVTVDLILGYQYKFLGKYNVRSQVNVKNMFNHYQLLFPPQVTGTPVVNNFIYTTSPRQWVWTNSVAF
jgi:hypothetical protein